MNEEIQNENDCCGNGCANCILDIKPIKFNPDTGQEGKHNILQKYSKFKLLNKQLHSPFVQDVWELHFKSVEAENHDYVLHINPGYHIMMRKPMDEGIYLLRPYSPYWWCGLQMEFKILVNLKPQGSMSKYIENLEIDDEIEFKGPIGSYEYVKDSETENILLIITQGVAIAPAMPLIETILNNEDDFTRIVHCACFQDVEHVYFRQRLYEFNKYWNYTSQIYLSRESCIDLRDKLKYKENIHPFRLDGQQLEEISKKFLPKTKTISAILAGTNNFQNYFKTLLLEEKTAFNFVKDNIHLL